VRGDYDGRGMGLRLELARRHSILRRRRGLLVRVPLHGHVLRVAVGRAILGHVVLVRRGIGIGMHGRVRLGRELVVVVVLLLVLPPAGHIWTGHHEGYTRCCLHSRRRPES